MRNLSFSDVLDSVCRSAGIDPHALPPRPAHRILRGTASRLQGIADRIFEYAAGTQGSANAFDPYLDQMRDAAPRRPRRLNDPGTVAAELSISSDMTLADLRRLRRQFALANHPDLAEPFERELATRRMMAANMLIDSELRRRRAASRTLRK